MEYMDTDETMAAPENDYYISDTIDFSFLMDLEELDVPAEPIRPDCCCPNSSQDGQIPDYPLKDLAIIQVPDYPFEDLAIISTADLMVEDMEQDNTAGTADHMDEMEPDNTAEINNSCLMSASNTSSVQEMSTECNKRKTLEAWVPDEIALNEPSPKRSMKEYLELKTAQPRKISKKVRKSQPSLRIGVLKGLTSKKVREKWNQICMDLFMNGTEVCCPKNCWVKWKMVDSMAKWY